MRLLKEMDEFAQSRYRLEARYHHVLVDEFQDTSRAQWELVAQLVRSWGEGLRRRRRRAAAVDLHRRRSQAVDLRLPRRRGRGARRGGGFIAGLRPDGESAARDLGQLPRGAGAAGVRQRRVRESIDEGARAARRVPVRRDRSVSGRAPGSCRAARAGRPRLAGQPVRLLPARRVAARPDRRRHASTAAADRVGATRSCALIGHATGPRSRDRRCARPAQPADIAILFRSRDSHREFEEALERRGVSTYVYKGLGLLRRRRSAGRRRAAAVPGRSAVGSAGGGVPAIAARAAVGRGDRRSGAAISPRRILARRAGREPTRLTTRIARCSTQLRAAVPRWLAWVDRLTPAELLRAAAGRDRLRAARCAGARRRQARENLKKLGAMVRRFQNRGYATLARRRRASRRAGGRRRIERGHRRATTPSA